MKTYQKWYQRILFFLVAVGLLSLAALPLLGGTAQAENVSKISDALPLLGVTPAPTPTYDPLLSLSGKVTDENGNPLQGIQVQIVGCCNSYKKITDAQGNYSQVGFHGGKYVVQISEMYSPPRVDVEIPPSISSVNFQRVQPTSTPTVTPLVGPTPTSTFTVVPTPVVVDSGFRLDEHAWNFPNRAFVPEQKHIDGAFGVDNARKLSAVVLDNGTAGSCFGYVVTASLLVHGSSLGLTPPVTPFLNTFNVPDPGENGDRYFLPSAVADYIIQSHYRQFSIEYSNELKASRMMSLGEQINAIKQSIDDKFNTNPVIIGLLNRSDDCGGHAVVPISYTVSHDGRTEVGVYDPNHPVGMNEYQHIIFDESNQSWSYTPKGENVSFGSDVVCINATSQRLKSKIEISYAKTYSKPTTPVWWLSRLKNVPSIVWMEVSNWVVTVRDAAGNVLGDVGGEIVENIPNSFVFTPLDQLGGNSKSWYVVQAGTPITATIHYTNPTDDAVTLFAHKAIFDVGLAESGVTTDTLVIDSSGDAVSLFGGGSRSITTTRLLTGTEQIFTLGMQESDQVRVQILDDGSLEFFTTTAQEVTLTLEQDGEGGNEQYQLLLPPFAAGDAQMITPQWQNHSATVSIDLGNDGTIDHTLTVQEETSFQPAVIYLPLIMR